LGVAIKFRRSADDHGSGHEEAAYTDIWAQPLSYPGALPEYPQEAILVSVEDGGEDLV